MPIRRVNHVVLSVSDIRASARFYTEVLGLRLAAELPETPTWPAMVFLRSAHETTNHHDVGLIENATSAAEDLSAMLRRPEAVGWPAGHRCGRRRTGLSVIARERAGRAARGRR